MSLFFRLGLGRSRAYRTSQRRAARTRPRCRPLLEQLEDRLAPTVSVLHSFTGMNFNDTASGGEPPDTIVAAGPNHVVELVNTAIRVYNKNGGVLSTQELSTFFSSLGAVGQMSDPQISYDELTNRFVVGILDFDLPGVGRSQFDFAVSNTSDPTGGWAFRRYDMNDLIDGIADFADYPRMGWNADAYVISFNMFLNAATYDHVDTLSIDKSTLAGHRQIVPGALTNFTMAPATMHGAAPGGPMWLVEGAGADPGGDALPGTTIRAVRMDNVLGAATFTPYSVAVTPYFNPFPALQPGGIFNTNDARILNAAWRGGRLLASQTVAGLFAAHARWYELNTAGVAPALTQTGEINAGLLVSTYYPSIEVNVAGDLGLTYMQSSFRQYVSVYVTGQKQGAAPGTLQAGVLVHAGVGTYLGTRGGDYSGISVDPVDDTFWAANEYSRSSFDLWGTWIANFAISATISPRRAAGLAPPHKQAVTNLIGLLPADVVAEGGRLEIRGEIGLKKAFSDESFYHAVGIQEFFGLLRAPI
jgi:large repetitive protein